MKAPGKRDYAEHSRFALLNPKDYIQHVNRALRDGKGPIEGNYFEDIYNRALREAKVKAGKDTLTVGSINRVG